MLQIHCNTRAWSWQSYENKSIYCFYTRESQNTLCPKGLQSVQSDDSLIFEAKRDKDMNQSHRGQIERSYSVGSQQNKMKGEIKEKKAEFCNAAGLLRFLV